MADDFLQFWELAEARAYPEGLCFLNQFVHSLD